MTRRRNLPDVPKQTHPINFGAKPDKLSPSVTQTCYSVYPVSSFFRLLPTKQVKEKLSICKRYFHERWIKSSSADHMIR